MKPQDSKPKATTQKQANAEKPISLTPLQFDEAVADVLKVKPPPKKKNKSERVKSEGLP